MTGWGPVIGRRGRSVPTPRSPRDTPGITTRAVWLATTAGLVMGWLTQGDDVPVLAACLLLPPIGYPYWSAHHTWRELAEALAHHGITSLRIDYHGTGDSAGTGWEPGRLAAWQQSHDASLAALRDLRPGPVGVVGLQLGASLALRSQHPPDFVAAWNPVVSGRRFVRALRLIATPVPAESGRPTGASYGGFPLPQDLLTDLAQVDLTKGTLAPRAVLLLGDEEHDNGPLAARLTELGTEVTSESASGDVMAVPAEEAETPHAVVARITDWVVAQLPAPAAEAPLTPRALDRSIPVGPHAIDDAGNSEDAVRIGPRQLVGILGTPASGPSRRVVVFLNSGSEPHIGPGRAWVEYARSLNRAGITTLRLDFSGWGESPSLDHTPGRPYDGHGIEETVEVVASLKQQGHEVILTGLCAGAWIALKAALLAPVDAVIPINAQLYWRPGHPVEALMSTTIARREPIRRREAAERASVSGTPWTGSASATARAGGSARSSAVASRCTSCSPRATRAWSSCATGWAAASGGCSPPGGATPAEVPEIDHSMHRSWLRGGVDAELRRFALGKRTDEPAGAEAGVNAATFNRPDVARPTPPAGRTWVSGARWGTSPPRSRAARSSTSASAPGAPPCCCASASARTTSASTSPRTPSRSPGASCPASTSATATPATCTSSATRRGTWSCSPSTASTRSATRTGAGCSTRWSACSARAGGSGTPRSTSTAGTPARVRG